MRGLVCVCVLGGGDWGEGGVDGIVAAFEFPDSGGAIVRSVV